MAFPDPSVAEAGGFFLGRIFSLPYPPRIHSKALRVKATKLGFLDGAFRSRRKSAPASGWDLFNNIVAFIWRREQMLLLAESAEVFWRGKSGKNAPRGVLGVAVQEQSCIPLVIVL